MEIKGFKKDWTTFWDINPGTVFEYEDDLYMKVQNSSTHNSVALSDGGMNTFKNSDAVCVIKGAFVIER